MQLKAMIPKQIRPVVQSAYYWLFRCGVRANCWCSDRFAGRTDVVDADSIPPAMLRFRVGETASVSSFVNVGRDTATAIEAALESIGRPFKTFDSILDFGCGCGRTLIWFVRKFPGKQLCGSDVNEQAVDWCRAHLAPAHFSLNATLPPSGYQDGAFDLVYAISVFTHLSEGHQRLWLAELHRVIRPGGVLLLSVHGELSWNGLLPEDIATLQQEGLLFKTSSKLFGIVPDWYHTAYHSQKYVLETFLLLFKPLAYLEGGLGYQDLVILQR